MPGTGTNDQHVATPCLYEHKEGWANTDRRRAWQGIVYLPENKNENENARTTLHLAGLVDSTSDNSYEVPLIKDPTGTKTSTLDRGKFYDLTLLVTSLQTTELKFVINPFTTQQLIYDLQGPVYLYVDKNIFEVKSGEEYRFTYESNVPIDWYSPEYSWTEGGTTKKVEFYDISTDGNEIVVRVNSAIPYTELAKLDTDEKKAPYKFFHIVAGNLHKKIIVNPLTLTPFLTVDPEEITIDVRAEIAGGSYGGMIGDGAFEIVVKTNLPTYTVNASNWDELIANEKNESDLIILCDAEGNPVEFGKPRPVTNGQETLYLVYDKLNSGESFWLSKHDLGLNFVPPAGSGADEDSVPIYTKPSTDNFTIHMKPWDGWTDPHVYIYQCLEIPGWFHINNGTNSDDWKFANKPVGYTMGNGKVAALEYSYTGKISFLGWSAPANKSLLDQLHSGYGMDPSGFYTFANDPLSLEKGDAEKKTHYNLEYDFFAEYRTAQDKDGNYLCKDCCRTGNSQTWPGIAMQNEENGWYKIELTGAAVPGRTLIMFANTHAGQGNSNRYPNDLEVGIPLFDYDTREGWIDMTKNEKTFTPKDPNKPDPNAAPTSGIHTFRIEWWYDSGNLEYCRTWTGSSQNISYHKGNDAGEGHLYYEFTADVATYDVKWLFKANNDDNNWNVAQSKDYDGGISQFSWNPTLKKFIFKEKVTQNIHN